METHTIRSRDGFLAQCGHYLFEDFNENPDETIDALGVYFHPKIIRRIFLHDTLDWNTENQKIEISDMLESYVTSILHYLENPQLFDNEMKLLKLKELLLLLAHSSHAPSINHFIGSLFSKRTYDLTQVVERNLYSSIGVEQLAFLSNLSLSSFKREFQKVYNESPASYLRKRRINKARELIRKTQDPISQIAYSCGFESVNSFNRTFKELSGCAPSDFRLNQMEY